MNKKTGCGGLLVIVLIALVFSFAMTNRMMNRDESSDSDERTSVDVVTTTTTTAKAEEPKETEKPEETEKPKETEKQKETEKPAEPEKAETEDTTDNAKREFGIEYVSSQLVTDMWNSEPFLLVTLRFYNNSDKAYAYTKSLAYVAEAYQNGIQCDNILFYEGSEDNITKIQPGYNILVTEAFALTDRSPVQLKVSRLSIFDEAPEIDTTITFQ